MQKKISLKYGNKKFELKIEKNKIKNILNTNSSDDSKEFKKIIKEALAHPVGSKKLSKKVSSGEKAVVVISDITRSWQKISQFLPHIIEELKKGGVKLEDITVLAATGSHRSHNEKEIKLLLGEKYYKKIKFVDHNAEDKDQLKYLGKTSFGTPLWINKLALNADRLILTGGIVFHDLAGFAGGRKSLLPGIAGYESIMKNHSLSLSKNEGDGIKETVTTNHMDDNPVNRDMLEAAAEIDVDFIFNVIPDGKGGIAAAAAGDLIKAHQKGCEICRNLFGIPLQEKSELVFASAGGYPKDINLYQGSKALVNAVRAVKKGGTLILLSECSEGIGHPEVKEIIQDYKNNMEREKFLRSDFTISRYTGYLITKKIEDINLILVSDIDPKLLDNTEIRVVKTMEEALELLKEEFKEIPESYIMPAAANTLPILN